MHFLKLYDIRRFPECMNRGCIVDKSQCVPLIICDVECIPQSVKAVQTTMVYCMMATVRFVWQGWEMNSLHFTVR